MIFISQIIFFCLALAVTATASSAAQLTHHSSFHRRSQVTTWLATHNAVRAAYDVPELTWSTSLAVNAATWAQNCKFLPTHGVLSPTPYGENIAAGTGHFLIPDAVKVFTRDTDQFDHANPSFSQWTQVVWNSTTELGCASASCPGLIPTTRKTTILHVCFYGPPGNVLGQATGNVPF